MGVANPRAGGGTEADSTGRSPRQSHTQTSVHHLPAPVSCLGGGGRVVMSLRAVVFDLDGILVLPSISRTLACTEEQLALPR